METNAIVKIGMTVFLAGGVVMGLTTCSNMGDGTVATEETADVVIEVDTATVSDSSADEFSPDAIMLPSGWMADASDPRQVVIIDPTSSLDYQKVTVTIVEDADGATASQLAGDLLQQVAPGMATAQVSEEPIGDETWSVFRANAYGGSAFHDEVDGGVRRLSWNACSFEAARDAFLEYEELMSSRQ